MNRIPSSPLFFTLTVVAVAASVWLSSPSVADEAAPAAIATCPQAHAHNDYLHQRPLLDALEQGFCSVEADIFLVDGELLVAHSRFELDPARTLRGLYLDPLRQRIEANGGSVHGDGQPFTLLIDIKSDAETTYRALHQVLSDYAPLLTRVTDGQVAAGAVTVVISGNRAIDVIAADSPRYAGIDGRLSDLESDSPAHLMPTHLMPLISDHWGRQFKWRGKGEMPAAEREKLQQILQQTHAQGRRLRLWASPDNEATWAALQAAGVDLINTDNLVGLSNFLRSNQSQN
jgi:hypothetical protein